MTSELDDPIARREKREAESLLNDPVENLVFPKVEDVKKESKEEVEDLLSVLDTVEKESKKKYKE
jgi:hypothetical protein